jgi:glucose/arabinose dehydrogenase
MMYRMPLEPMRRSPFAVIAGVLLGFICLAGSGCLHSPAMIPLAKQHPIDRKYIEYPSGFELMLAVDGLNSPTAIAVDDNGSLLVAESGLSGPEPHIFGYKRDGTYFNIYPFARTVSFFPRGFVLYGPIGGMVARGGKVYVSSRDRDGTGIITALGYDGSHATVIANLPARGDYGVTDLAIGPTDNRLYFGLGTATNSGVVGLDNWDEGWLKRYPSVHDLPYGPERTVYLLGQRFDTPNPRAGLFSAGDIAVTAPFQEFSVSNRSRIPRADIPNGAIISIPLDGGETRVEAYGLHNPRGIAFDEYGTPYLTNDGMEMRGTRPVMDDRDSLLRLSRGVWYGWPDYTTDLHAVNEAEFQPPLELLIKSGFDELSFLIDHDRSKLHPPRPEDVVAGKLPSLSGAAKFAFAPSAGPLRRFSGDAIIACDGNRAPFATSGFTSFVGSFGFKVVLVDRSIRRVTDFIHNTAGVPSSMLPIGSGITLERPIDVKVGPDGVLYVLDFGRMVNTHAIPRYFPGTGRIFKLAPVAPAAAASQANPQMGD